jgi:hypothetical protein
MWLAVSGIYAKRQLAQSVKLEQKCWQRHNAYAVLVPASLNGGDWRWVAESLVDPRLVH